MTLVTGSEIVTIGENSYYMGEEITATPEAILALEGLGKNVVLVAQPLTKDGEIPTVTKTTPNPCPIYPTPEQIQADPTAKEAYRQAYEAYLERKATLKAAEVLPVPPSVGRPSIPEENSAYFHLDQIGTSTTGILPLEIGGRRSATPYRFHIAEIVE